MKLALIFVVAVCALSGSVFSQEQKEWVKRTLPPDTVGLIELLDAQTGEEPDIVYQWLMVMSDRPHFNQERQSEPLRLATERLMQRSNGMTLKFTVGLWAYLSTQQNECLSDQQIKFLLGLLNDQTYMQITIDDWPYRLPYRFRFATPTTVLSRADIESVHLIVAKLDDDQPHVRAAALDILSLRRILNHNDVSEQLIDRVIELAGDESTQVRTAVASAIGTFPAAQPVRCLDVLRKLAKSNDPLVHVPALQSTWRFAEHVSAEHAAEITRDIATYPMHSKTQAAAVLDRVTQFGNEAVCDAVHDEALVLVVDPKFSAARNRGVEVLARAARNSSPEKREQAVRVLCQVIAESDDVDEMNAILNIGALADKLSSEARFMVTDQLLKIIEGPVKDRNVRIDQAAAAATRMVPLLDQAEQKLVLTRMTPILHRPQKANAAANVIGAMGNASIDAISDLMRLTKAKDPWVRLAAAKAIWNVQASAKVCADVYLSVLTDGPDTARIQARRGLIEMGSEATVVLPELVELLEHKKAGSYASDVLTKLATESE